MISNDVKTNNWSVRGANDGSRCQALVAVVDDQRVVAQMTASYLELQGYRTRTFYNSNEALKAIESGDLSPDLLLTEYEMGGVDGLELIERCKSRSPRLRSILSSSSFDKVSAGARTALPDRIMPKPYGPKALLGLVRSALS